MSNAIGICLTPHVLIRKCVSFHTHVSFPVSHPTGDCVLSPRHVPYHSAICRINRCAFHSPDMYLIAVICVSAPTCASHAQSISLTPYACLLSARYVSYHPGMPFIPQVYVSLSRYLSNPTGMCHAQGIILYHTPCTYLITHLSVWPCR